MGAANVTKKKRSARERALWLKSNSESGEFFADRTISFISYFVVRAYCERRATGVIQVVG